MTIHKMYTPEQVAKILQVSTETLKNWRWKKVGPKWVNLNSGNGMVRYVEEDLAAYQEGVRE